jgi:hypothetical protein
MGCRRQAPTRRHANPTLAGGSDDEAPSTNRCWARAPPLDGAFGEGSSRDRRGATRGDFVADLELKYEHLSPHPRDTPARRERRRKLAEHIEAIWAEQELSNRQIRETLPDRSGKILPPPPRT